MLTFRIDLAAAKTSMSSDSRDVSEEEEEEEKEEEEEEEEEMLYSVWVNIRV